MTLWNYTRKYSVHLREKILKQIFEFLCFHAHPQLICDFHSRVVLPHQGSNISVPQISTGRFKSCGMMHL